MPCNSVPTQREGEERTISQVTLPAYPKSHAGEIHSMNQSASLLETLKTVPPHTQSDIYRGVQLGSRITRSSLYTRFLQAIQTTSSIHACTISSEMPPLTANPTLHCEVQSG